METISLPTSFQRLEGDETRAVFAIEPLYPGYGITVGNALRRVLLSSLPGAAITNVSFEGASHEFSTLPYVKEDVVDIILNLKKVRLKLHGQGPATLTLRAKGAKTVTAGDIEANSEVDVISQDQVIATLTDKAAALSLTLQVEAGRGYVPVEQRDTPKNPIGTIAIDAVFSPIKNVNFTTENVRVGQMTNYDRLRLDISTDGSINPAAALEQAAKILVSHFQFLEGQPTEMAGPEVVADKEEPSAASAEEPGEVVAEKPKRKSRAKPSDE